MSRRNLHVAAGPGRPQYDDLDIYLRVTAAAELAGMSINKFCKFAKFDLVGVTIAPGDKRLPHGALRTRLEERRSTHLTGASLRRRYSHSKKMVLGPFGGVRPPVLEGLIAEMKMHLRREAGL